VKFLRRAKAKAKDLKIKVTVGKAVLREKKTIDRECAAAAKEGTCWADRVRLWGAAARTLIVVSRYYGPEVLRYVAQHNVVIRGVLRGVLRGLLIMADLAHKAAKALKPS